MARIYGHKWVSNFGESDDGTWLTGLKDLTPQQIGKGLSSCLDKFKGWPPALPEFRALCKLTAMDVGLPEFETAYRHACEKKWSHPFVYEIYMRIGQWDMSRTADQLLRRRFEKVYDEITQEFVAGKLEFKKPVDKKFRIEKYDEKFKLESDLTPAECIFKMKDILGMNREEDLI